MSNIQYIWNFGGHRHRYLEETDKFKGSGGAPILIPAGRSGYLEDAGATLGIQDIRSTKNNPPPILVDVVNEFPWTQSPKGARTEVPWIKLREMYVNANPLLNQIARNLAIVGEGVADITNSTTLQQLTENLAGKVQDIAEGATEYVNNGKESLKDESITQKDGRAENNSLRPYQEGAINNVARAATTATGIVGKSAGMLKDVASVDPSDVLLPYRHMYVTEDTGFVYKFPYYNNKQKKVANSWGASSEIGGGIGVFGEGAITSILGAGSEAFANMSQIHNILEPGKYNDKPLFYTGYQNAKNSYTVSFPLSNTGTYDELLQNWQLVYLLVYQNLQNRLSRTLSAPPVIYEAEIPGIWYSPYAFISDIDIKFVGTRRAMSIDIPTVPQTAMTPVDSGFGPETIQTVIPEVYEVSFTVNDMHPDSQNLQHRTVSPYKNNKVRVKSKFDPNSIDTSDLYNYKGDDSAINLKRKAIFDTLYND